MEGIGEAFCRRYLDSGVWMFTNWLGTQVIKCPLDLWIYQEILSETRPDVIVETGTWTGGSALYLASICDLLGHGRVITIDIQDRPERPSHSRITYVTGNSVDPEVIDGVREEIGADQTTMVILDSDHSTQHVLAELRAYAPLVSAGGYLIAEDTVATMMIPPVPDSGPLEAVQRFLAENPEFSVDEGCEKFLMSWHSGGFLRRVAAAEVPARRSAAAAGTGS
jgi:cephalosporin hydroxylase